MRTTHLIATLVGLLAIGLVIPRPQRCTTPVSPNGDSETQAPEARCIRPILGKQSYRPDNTLHMDRYRSRRDRLRQVLFRLGTRCPPVFLRNWL